MKKFDCLAKELIENPKTWLITGVAGFIGSNLLEKLLLLNQRVVGLDNFSTGYKENLENVKCQVSTEQWSKFEFIYGDVRNRENCIQAMAWVRGEDNIPVEYVLHQAALGSVPRSIVDPINTNENNISGFLNVLDAARTNKVRNFVYAASSSTYGDHPGLPKSENYIGNPLSPYAVTKYVNELYASVYARCYGFGAIGLRYFNVFGKRQDPDGAYAAVIPKWINAVINGEVVYVNGDGETSRDFCYVDNAVQANILAACSDDCSGVYNVAVGDRTSLNELYEKIYKYISEERGESISKRQYKEFRSGDVRHSQADIKKIKEVLGYVPEYKIDEGLRATVKWFCSK